MRRAFYQTIFLYIRVFHKEDILGQAGTLVFNTYFSISGIGGILLLRTYLLISGLGAHVGMLDFNTNLLRSGQVFTQLVGSLCCHIFFTITIC